MQRMKCVEESRNDHPNSVIPDRTPVGCSNGNGIISRVILLTLTSAKRMSLFCLSQDAKCRIFKPFQNQMLSTKETTAKDRMKFDIHADAPFDIKQDIDDLYYAYILFIQVPSRCRIP